MIFAADPIRMTVSAPLSRTPEEYAHRKRTHTGSVRKKGRPKAARFFDAVRTD